MADEEQNQQTEEQPKKKKKLPTTLIIVLVVALVEGAGFFAASKMMGGGTQIAHGAEEGDGHVMEGEEGADGPANAEVSVLERIRVPNSDGGRQYIYDFDLAVKVPSYRKEEMEKLVEERKAEIADRVARIIRRAKRQQLSEAELKTLRVQIQHTLGEIAGDQEMIKEILLPRWVPMRTD